MTTFKTEVIQIAPETVGATLSIQKDSASNSLQFQDGLVGPINLRDLASLGTLSNVFVVGTGAGAKYSTISAAVTAVSGSSSPTNPSLILVMPGTYTENVVIQKDGISIVGFGYPILTAPASSSNPTVLIQDGVSTHPTTVLLQGLQIVNPNTGQTCLSIQGGSGSTVGSSTLRVMDCLFNAPSGGYAINGSQANTLTVRGSDLRLGDSTSVVLISQMASVAFRDCSLFGIEMDYNSSGVLPSVAGSLYTIENCPVVGAVASTLTGAGSLRVTACPSIVSMTVNGNQSGVVSNSSISGAVAINGTFALTLLRTSRGSASGAGTLSESALFGSTNFAASASQAVTFPVTKPSANYQVSLDTGVQSTVIATTKASTGFTITFPGVETTTVFWKVEEFL